jgi:hypothetical protein
MALEPIRELLILSAHSCAQATAFLEGHLGGPTLARLLLEAVRDADDFGSGDVRIEAAHYLGLLTGESLKAHGTELLALFDAENDDAPGGNMRPLLSLALARGGILGGKERIERELKDEPSVFDQHFRNAFEIYSKGA